MHTAKRDEELCQPQTPIKLSKKEKKKQKESKKLAKQKKMDADKVSELEENEIDCVVKADFIRQSRRISASASDFSSIL